MAADKKELHLLAALAADEEIWQPMEIDQEARVQVLRLVAEGNPALALKRLPLTVPLAGNAVFRKKNIAGEDWLVPQRFERMVDFFLRRAADLPRDTSNLAVTELLMSPANCLLTGGPGTGKSYQIAALVRHLAEQATERPLRITIAAPTGKAAARFAQLKTTDGVLLECVTIHRLLGLSGDFSEPRFHARHPLGIDLLIVDEISMLDLGLFTALISALPDHARVVLAGDLGQLPAVDGMPIDHCLAFLEHCGLVARVHLSKVYRFSEGRARTYQRIAESGLSGIDEHSEGVSLHAVRYAAEARDLLERHAAERFHSAAASRFRERLAADSANNKPNTELTREILAWLREQVVLTTRREGLLGSVGLNTAIASRIAQDTRDRTLTPIIASTNNYRLGVFNGDMGFITNYQGREYAVIEASAGDVVVVPLSELSGWQPAYAITVHKSQGSEYGEVWLVYEENAGEIAEDFRLLYTAVTRARNHAHVLRIATTGKRP